ncbi:hypothetical protein [Streptomyces formicae]
MTRTAPNGMAPKNGMAHRRADGGGGPVDRPGRSKVVTAVVTSSLVIVVSGLAAVFLVWYANNTQECYQPDSFHQYTQCVREHLNGN